MSFRNLILTRNFSLRCPLRQSILSTRYKSRELWDERYKCKLLNDEELVKSINNKVIKENDLNSLEIDLFINIAPPSLTETAQLQELVKQLARIRRSLYAHTLLPSTPPAACRLFLYSQRLPSLLHILDNRIDYGIFPDNFSMNLLIDEALNKEHYNIASRLAALIMYQEEFGENYITDMLSWISLTKYLESKTDFKDWNTHSLADDPIFSDSIERTKEKTDVQAAETKKEEEDVDDEDEEDVEYVRIPFLRNPYFDNHFDLKNPRLICGKTLSMLGKSLIEPRMKKLANESILLGYILQGKWSDAMGLLDAKESTLSSNREIIENYLVNLHDIDAPPDNLKSDLLTRLKSVPATEKHLSELITESVGDLGEMEDMDIRWLRASFVEYSEKRNAMLKAQREKLAREKLIAEIRSKKEELSRKEQYLYFYDNLRRSRVTRIEYT